MIKKPSGGGMDAAETNALAGVLRYPYQYKTLYSIADSAKLRGKKMARKPFFYPDGLPKLKNPSLTISNNAFSFRL